MLSVLISTQISLSVYSIRRYLRRAKVVQCKTQINRMQLIVVTCTCHPLLVCTKPVDSVEGTLWFASQTLSILCYLPPSNSAKMASQSTSMPSEEIIRIYFLWHTCILSHYFIFTCTLPLCTSVKYSSLATSTSVNSCQL